eukprot:752456-Hanusia_phi.AAC.6
MTFKCSSNMSHAQSHSEHLSRCMFVSKPPMLASAPRHPSQNLRLALPCTDGVDTPRIPADILTDTFMDPTGVRSEPLPPGAEPSESPPLGR